MSIKVFLYKFQTSGNNRQNKLTWSENFCSDSVHKNSPAGAGGDNHEVLNYNSNNNNNEGDFDIDGDFDDDEIQRALELSLVETQTVSCLQIDLFCPTINPLKTIEFAQMTKKHYDQGPIS